LCLKSQIPSTKKQTSSKLQAPNSKEIPNYKHQITTIKHQVTNTNDLNYFDLFSIDENIFFNSFASCLKFWASLAFFKVIYWFVIWNFGHAQRRRLRRVLIFICNLMLVIWNLIYSI
jgi:hypothetical protein